MLPWFALMCVVLLASANGFGATVEPTANVLGTISLTDPTTLAATPPICTDALAPLDTDDCADVTFAGGASRALRLGSLSGSDVQAGSLQWLVTTTSPTGYRVRMSNAGPAPLLQNTSASIADMSSSALVPAGAVAGATHFGVALGDAYTDDQGSVAFAGSPWLTAAGQQGELFSGIPTSGMVVAERTSPQTSDPFTATFAVAATAAQQPAVGAYAGTVRLVASII